MAALLRSVLVLALLVGASFAAARLTPRAEVTRPDALGALIPEQFGRWSAEPESVSPVMLVPDALGDAVAAQSATYDDVLMRTYRRDDGARVMVALAYGRRQTQEIKIHRPELCYYAQGFAVQSLGVRAVHLSAARNVESHALLTQNRARTEVVTYWIRVGESVANDPWSVRWTIFREGLSGRVPDGLLVRTSSLAASAGDAERELALQQEFLADLYRATPAATRTFLAAAGDTHGDAHGDAHSDGRGPARGEASL